MNVLCIADEPGAPGVPDIVDWDKDHVDLKWAKPVNDGGSPITGYVIEKREKGTGKWIKAAEVNKQFILQLLIILSLRFSNSEAVDM